MFRFEPKMHFSTDQGAKHWGVARICEKRSNLTKLMTIITKEIKNTSRIVKVVQVGQFDKLDIGDKRLHRSNPFSQRTSTFG